MRIIPLSVASHLAKALGRAVVDGLIDHFTISSLVLFLVLLSGSVLIQKARMGRLTSQKWLALEITEKPGTYRRFALAAAAIICPVMFVATVRAMMTMEGQITGEPEMQSFAIVLIMPSARGEGLIKADVVITDQGGHFTKRWMIPGDYQLLILTHGATTLRYSIASRSKGWFKSNEVFRTNGREMEFFGKAVDKFRLNSASMPADGEGILALPKRLDFSDAFYLLVGHADASGTDSHNYALGLARAKDAAAALEEQGVPANHIIVGSLGSAYPAGKPPGIDKRALDRRIECMRVPDPFSIQTILSE